MNDLYWKEDHEHLNDRVNQQMEPFEYLGAGWLLLSFLEQIVWQQSSRALCHRPGAVRVHEHVYAAVCETGLNPGLS